MRRRAAANAREINDTIRYTMWSVFAADRLPAAPTAPALVAEVEELLSQLRRPRTSSSAARTTSPGLRADADLMVWWHAPTIEALQEAYQRLRRTALGRQLRPGLVGGWRCTARPSSTRATSRRSWPTRSRAPTSACTRSSAPTTGTCCPTPSAAACSSSTARWPAGTRTCAPTPSSSFALGDYEWMLAFEADELHRIVDLMRDLRATDARRHVREEIPFYTGPRVPLAELVAALP